MFFLAMSSAVSRYNRSASKSVRIEGNEEQNTKKCLISKQTVYQASSVDQTAPSWLPMTEFSSGPEATDPEDAAAAMWLVRR